MTFMEAGFGHDDRWQDPGAEARINLHEFNVYKIELGMRNNPTVLLIMNPKLNARTKERRALAIVIDPGDARLQAGKLINPLANVFRAYTGS